MPDDPAALKLMLHKRDLALKRMTRRFIVLSDRIIKSAKRYTRKFESIDVQIDKLRERHEELEERYTKILRLKDQTIESLKAHVTRDQVAIDKYDDLLRATDAKLTEANTQLWAIQGMYVQPGHEPNSSTGGCRWHRSCP